MICTCETCQKKGTFEEISACEKKHVVEKQRKDESANNILKDIVELTEQLNRSIDDYLLIKGEEGVIDILNVALEGTLSNPTTGQENLRGAHRNIVSVDEVSDEPLLFNFKRVINEQAPKVKEKISDAVSATKKNDDRFLNEILDFIQSIEK